MAQVQRRHAMKSNKAVVRQSLRDYLIMALVVMLIVVAVITVKRMREPAPGVTQAGFTSTETFLNGVSVNGVELGGMTYEDGLAAVKQQINNRLNSPINLHYNGETYTITPAELDAKMTGLDENMALAWGFGHTGDVEERQSHVAYLQNGGDASYNCQLQYSQEKLDAFINQVKVNVDVNPVNASIKTDTTQLFEITPHKDGLSLDADALKAQVVSVIEQGTSADFELKPKVWRPKYTTADMEDCTTEIAVAVTDARSSNENRVKNIKRALKPFKMLIVQPDETVSFNNLVKKRTIENGFYPAPEFVDGTLAEGIGGGTCQASTTLFQALVNAGFRIDARTQHSLRVAYCKPSQDATVTDSGKDLVFTNTTEYPMYIFASCNGVEARVTIYGRKPEYKIKYVTKGITKNIPWEGWDEVPDTSHKFAKKPGQKVLKSEGKVGCVTEGWRQFYDWNTGEMVKEERLYHDEYKPMKPVYYVYAE